MNLRLLISLVGVCALLTASAAAAADAPGACKSIELGIGVVASSGFSDAVEGRFPPDQYDLSGAGTLFDVECGLGLPAGTRVTVTPRLRLLAKSVTISAYQGLPGSQYAVMVFLPGVSVRYALAPGRSPFYVCGDLALVSATADDEIMTIGGRGASFGAAVGASLGQGRVDIELGHWSVPVSEDEPEPGDENFGGTGVIVRTRWFLR